MYKELTTGVDVTVDTSVSPSLVGKPISKIYQVAFANEGVSIVGKFEGAADRQWSAKFTRDELPTNEAKGLYDAVVAAVDSLHLSIRKADENYTTDNWVEYVEPVEE